MKLFLKLLSTQLISYMTFFVIGMYFGSIYILSSGSVEENIFFSVFGGGFYFANLYFILFYVYTGFIFLMTALYYIKAMHRYLAITIVLETIILSLVLFVPILEEKSIISFFSLLFLPIGAYIKYISIQKILKNNRDS